jgi:glutaredoxin-like protein
MALLNDKDKTFLIEEFTKKLVNPVRLVVFTQQFECEYCRETRQIAEELAALSAQITLDVYDFVAQKDLAAQLGVTQIPATVVLRGGDQPKDYGIHYYGVPAGYEFTSLVHDILMVGSGESGLSEATKQWVSTLTTPVHIQVFVTPTCPYCPPAVLLAHKLAMESDLIRADMVEATEFPHLANRYDVMGVPRTVINEDFHVEGAVPEPVFLQRIQEAIAH